MHFDTLPQQIAGSLLIGGEIFVIAALWPLSEWAAATWRHRGFVLALAVAIACIALDSHALAFARLAGDPQRWGRVDAVLAWLVPPLFLAFPGAVCVASAQSLRHAGLRAATARVVALVVAVLAVLVAPFAALAAACGLAGMCV